MTKYKFTYDETRIIIMSLIELKNQLVREGRYTDAVDDLLIKFMNNLLRPSAGYPRLCRRREECAHAFNTFLEHIFSCYVLT